VVFVLSDVEGLSNEETAKILGLTVPAIKSRLHRARLYLREQLSRYLLEGRAEKAVRRPEASRAPGGNRAVSRT
ncbi:MAG: sigma factor-like helix-turn-helix DNA-binding protein, partial [bacterium]